MLELGLVGGSGGAIVAASASRGFVGKSADLPSRESGGSGWPSMVYYAVPPQASAVASPQGWIRDAGGEFGEFMRGWGMDKD